MFPLTCIFTVLYSPFEIGVLSVHPSLDTDGDWSINRWLFDVGEDYNKWTTNLYSQPFLVEFNMNS